MDTKALLVELTRRGITVRISGGQIEYTATQKALSPEMKAELTRREREILSLYSGCPISDSLHHIAEIWDADVETRGEGDAAWSWIIASSHWTVIKAAEDEVDRIGRDGDPDELHTACSSWIAAWVQAIKSFCQSKGENGRKSKSQITFDY